MGNDNQGRWSAEHSACIGRCFDCGRSIAVEDIYSRRVGGRRPVYGRIGEPSSEITGFARGIEIYRCESCLVSIGPLT